MPPDNMDDPLARALCVRRIVSLLVTGNYQELEQLSHGVRLDAVSIKRAVADYGRTLVEPPGDAQFLEWYPISNSSPPAWSVDVTLFSAQEGRSDLTLTLTLTQHGPEKYHVEIEDLHVL